MVNVQEKASGSPPLRKSFAIVPTSVARDTGLSLGARHLYTVLDGRQGAKTCQRVRMATLAGDLGVCPKTISRYLAELVTAGYVTKKRTGKALILTVINHERGPRTIPRPVTSVHSDETPVSTPLSNNSMRNKKASSYENLTVTREPDKTTPAAAADRVDSITLEQFRDLLPDHLRPRPETHLAVTLAQALTRGWHIQGLVAAIKAEIPNPHAGPGMTVKMLRELSQRPADEYAGPPVRAPRYDRINECEHGVLKVYGGCIPCAEDRERAERAKVYSMAASEGQPFWEDGQL